MRSGPEEDATELAGIIKKDFISLCRLSEYEMGCVEVHR